MAARRDVEFDDLFSVDFEDMDLGGVHFTDEEFEFTIVLRNLTGERLTGTVEIRSETEATIGLDREPIRRFMIEVDLGPGEVHREPFRGVGMIGGSGLGLIGTVQRPEVVEAGDGTTVVEPTDQIIPVVSMVFWDREFYRANYLWPRRAQYLSVAFALLSAILAGAIVWLSIT